MTQRESDFANFWEQDAGGQILRSAACRMFTNVFDVTGAARHPRMISKRLREHLISLYYSYYSYYFDRKLPYSSELSQIISTWERGLERGYIPLAENVWDLDYSSGRWGYLRDLEEIPRYALIAGLFQSFKPGGLSLLSICRC